MHRSLSLSEPGSTFYYNNGDYILLGKIIESVEKDSFERVLHQRILSPLHIKNSGLLTNRNAKKIKNLAQGYTWNRKDSILKRDADKMIQNYYASGAMYATAEDLAKFSDALFLKKSLLNDTSIESLLATYPETNNYGYGLCVRFNDFNDDKTIVKVTERYGRIWGINTLFTYVFEHDISIISLSNNNKNNPWNVHNFIHKQFLD